jgi:hypothetical protein
MSRPTMVVYLVWSREGRTSAGEPARYDDPITYRDWPLVLRDIKAALDHGRQVRITAAQLSRATWATYPAPSPAQVRRLRGVIDGDTRENAE